MFHRGRHAVGVVAAGIVMTGAMSLPGFVETRKWWKSAKVQRELDLTGDQIATLDEIFQSNLPQRRRMAEEEQRLAVRLEAVFQAGVEETRTVHPLVDQVARIHAARNVSRTQMLVRMYRVLTAEQRQRMKSMAASRALTGECPHRDATESVLRAVDARLASGASRCASVWRGGGSGR